MVNIITKYTSKKRINELNLLIRKEINILSRKLLNILWERIIFNPKALLIFRESIILLNGSCSSGAYIMYKLFVQILSHCTLY